MTKTKNRNLLVAILAVISVICLAFGFSGLSRQTANAATTETYDFLTNGSSFPTISATKDSSKIAIAQTTFNMVSSEDATVTKDFVVAISTVTVGGNTRTASYKSTYGIEYQRCGTMAFTLNNEADVTIYVRGRNCVIGIDPYFGETYTGDTYQNYGTNSTQALAKDTKVNLTLAAGNYKICCPEATGGSWRIQSIVITEKAPAITSFTYSYDAGEGAGAPQGATDSSESAITIGAAPTTVPEGYVFAGWSDGKTTYQPEASYTLTAATTTFTAVYNPIISAVASTTISELKPVESTKESLIALLPATISGTATNGSVSAISVSWDLADGQDLSTAGEKTFVGTLTAPNGYALANGLTASATITLTDEKTIITSVATIASATINQGDEYTMPASVSCNYDGGSVNLPIIWNHTINTNLFGVQSFVGTIDTTGVLFDASAVSVNLTVNVKKYVEYGSVGYDYSTMKKSETAYYAFDGSTTTGDVTGLNAPFNDAKSGLSIVVANGASDNKDTETNTNMITACIKINMSESTGGAGTITLTVPAGKTAKFHIEYSSYASNGKLQLSNGSEIVKTLGQTTVVTKGNVFVPNIAEAELESGTYTVTAVSKTKNMYISKISLTDIEYVESDATVYYEAGTLATAPVVSGYTFIGWTKDNGATLANAGASAEANSSYEAVYAKIEYNGASIKTTGDAGVRHEFTVSFSNATLDETALQKSLAGTYKFNNYQQAIENFTVVDDAIKIYCVVVGYEANNETHYNYAITANASVVMNGVTIETANSTAQSAFAIATYWYGQNKLDATVAAQYGVVVNA